MLENYINSSDPTKEDCIENSCFRLKKPNFDTIFLLSPRAESRGYFKKPFNLTDFLRQFFL